MPLLMKKREVNVKSVWFGGIVTRGIAKAFPFVQLSVKCSTSCLFQRKSYNFGHVEVDFQ